MSPQDARTEPEATPAPQQGWFASSAGGVLAERLTGIETQDPMLLRAQARERLSSRCSETE